MDGASFPAEHMQQISQVSAAEVELRRNLVQFAPHLVCKLDELLQEERSKMRQQEYAKAPFLQCIIVTFK